MASHCSHCGVPTRVEARFCMSCGHEQGPPGAGPAAAPPPPGAAPVAPPPGPPPPGTPTLTGSTAPTAPPPPETSPAAGANTGDTVPEEHRAPSPLTTPPSTAPAASVPAYPYAPHVPQPGFGAGGRAAAEARRRALVWAVTLTVALVVGAGTAAGVLVWQDRNAADGPLAGQTPSVSPKGLRGAPSTGPSDDRSAEPPSPDATPTGPAPGPSAPSGSQGSGPAPVPAGYHRLDDPLGFSFAVPDVWAREGVENGTQVTYAGSTGPEHIQVGVIADAGYTSYANFLNLETTAARKNENYRRIKLERNTFRGRDAAVWEYTYTDGAGRTVHAKDQGYVAENGTEYAILAVGRDDLWKGGLADTHQVALDTWKLT